MSAKAVPIHVHPYFFCSFSVEHFWLGTRQHRRKRSGSMPWPLLCATDSSPLAPQGVASCSNWRQSSATPYTLFCSLFHWHVAKKRVFRTRSTEFKQLCCACVALLRLAQEVDCDYFIAFAALASSLPVFLFSTATHHEHTSLPLKFPDWPRKPHFNLILIYGISVVGRHCLLARSSQWHSETYIVAQLTRNIQKGYPAF